MIGFFAALLTGVIFMGSVLKITSRIASVTALPGPAVRLTGVFIVASMA